jgi:TRAP transporter TAXI family solute receptor
MRRRSLLLAPALSAAAAGLAACGASKTRTSRLYHDGRLYIGTGNTTGVYYLLGGAFADLVTRNVDGFEARAEPTNASVENLRRLATADMQLGFAQADAAADAVAGRAAFEGKPQQVTALARLYTNIAQMVVRTDLKVKSVADLRGRTISTGSPGSGTETVSLRVLGAAGLNPDTDVKRETLSLGQTTKGMKDNSVDAFIFVGGLPTPGIADLIAAAPAKYSFLALDSLLPTLNERFAGAYYGVTVPKDTYKLPADTPTLATANLLLAAPDMPEDLAHDLTALLFTHQNELAAAHPEGKSHTKDTAKDTASVPLHPGAARFYGA